MGNLPNSRNTTYAALSQVQAADLNDLQDFAIRRHNPHFVVPASGHLDSDAAETLPRIGATGAIGSKTGGQTATNIPLPLLRTGDIIEQIDIYTLEPSAVGEVALFTLQAINNVTGVADTIGDVITIGFTGATATHTWNDSTNDSVAELPYTIPADTRMQIRMVIPATTSNDETEVYGIKVAID